MNDVQFSDLMPESGRSPIIARYPSHPACTHLLNPGSDGSTHHNHGNGGHHGGHDHADHHDSHGGNNSHHPLS